jgi:glycosyltransferase involved in cell wall biosynthesis
VIYHSEGIDIRALFGLPERDSLVYKKVKANTFWARIFYEQLIFPFTLKRDDLYFAPTPVMPYLAKVVRPTVRHIVTIHDMIPFFVPKKYGRVRSVYVKLISIYSSKWADHVISVSENSKQDICELAKINPRKVVVIYNFMPSMEKPKQIRYEDFFLSISTIEPGKNIENTIRGFALFLRNHPGKDYKFYWIGKVGWGYTEQSLKALIDNAGLSEKFLLLGYVDEERKNDLLSNCTAMVYLSHYEGFGLPVLEGLYRQKPAVVSNTSSLPEVIGNAGVLCNKENAEDIARAITEVVDNLNKYLKAIPGQLEKFDKDLQVEKFINLVALNL